MARPPVVIIGLALSACSGAHNSESTSPQGALVPPEPAPSAPPASPPAASSTLPTWEQVPSPHPAGATNPPRPTLIVTPERRCFKRWVSPMVPPEQRVDRVESCVPSDTTDCGTEIVCPLRADELLAASPGPRSAP